MSSSGTRLHMSAHSRSICKELSNIFLCSLCTPRGTLQTSILSLTPHKHFAASFYGSHKRSHDVSPYFLRAVRKRWYKCKSLDVAPQEEFAQSSILNVFRFKKKKSHCIMFITWAVESGRPELKPLPCLVIAGLTSLHLKFISCKMGMTPYRVNVRNKRCEGHHINTCHAMLSLLFLLCKSRVVCSSSRSLFRSFDFKKRVAILHY